MIAAGEEDERELLVRIVGFEVNELSGRKPFVEFKINVQVGKEKLSWFIFRRFSQISKLNKELKREFGKGKKTKCPEFQEPSLKDSIRRKKDQVRMNEFIAKRIDILNAYFAELATNPEIASSYSFMAFLGAVEDLRSMAKFDFPSKTIHVNRLGEFANAGDIVLFHTPGILSSAYRAIIGSPWDHVGIIVYNTVNPHSTNDHRKFRILEATIDGVHSYPLNLRLKLWKDSYPGMRIAIRRLNVERNSIFEERLNRFVEKNVGLPYSISPFIKFRKSNQFPDNAEIEDESDEFESITKESWFCSELVAKCYKYLGIFPAEKASSSYQPFTFALESSRLNLQHATFEDLVLLKFKLLDVSKAAEKFSETYDSPKLKTQSSQVEEKKSETVHLKRQLTPRHSIPSYLRIRAPISPKQQSNFPNSILENSPEIVEQSP